VCTVHMAIIYKCCWPTGLNLTAGHL